MSKEQHFSMLTDTVKYCNLCERLCSSTRVLSENNGNINSNVLFVGEAPGRLGADKTKIPFFGDKAGNNFQTLIDIIGWPREGFFITNSVLCNPRSSNGNNDKPTKQEVTNCSIYLHMTIQLMDPKYIITLGNVALEALRFITKHNLTLKDNVRQKVSWSNRFLIPLYHTSPRAMIHRSMHNQIADFYFVNSTVKRKTTSSKKHKIVKLSTVQSQGEFRHSKIQELILYILNSVKNLSKFKLTKLIYLIDYEALKQDRGLLTRSFYIRAFDGPMPTNITAKLAQLEGKEITTYFRNRKPFVRLHNSPRFEPSFNYENCKLIDNILKKYANKEDEVIKMSVYFTKPMKRLLQKEKSKKNTIGEPLFTEEDLG